jgi:hypothetical protein
MMNSPNPLDNYAVIRTALVDEVQEAISKIYAKPKMELAPTTKTLNASINNCNLQHISLAYGTYSAAMRLEFPAVDRFMQLVPIRGRGEVLSGNDSALLTVDDGAVISPDAGYIANYAGNREHLALKIDAPALTNKLTALTGITISKPLRMDLQVDFTRPMARTLREYLPLLVNTLSAANPPFPNWWISQTEQLVMVMFLFGHRHNYSHLLERETLDVAPRQVRRAEEYIEANWQQPITLEDLAEVSGVSAFDLSRAFQKSRGYSPLEFASQFQSRRKGLH